MKRIILITAIMLYASHSSAATRTVSNGGGNWSSVGTWVEGAAATSSDAVVVTATSGTLTCDLGCSAASMDFTGFPAASAFSVASGKIVTVSGNYTQAVNMTVTGTGTIAINAASTIDFGGAIFPGTVNLISSTTTTMAGSIAGGLTVGGNFNPTVALSGDLTIGAAMGPGGSNSSLIFTGNHGVTCATLVFSEGQSGKSLTWAAGTTLTVTGGMSLSAGGGVGWLTMKSGAASSPAYLNYQGTQANASIIQMAFTDIDASGGNPIYIYHAGALTRTVSVYGIASPPAGNSVSY